MVGETFRAAHYCYCVLSSALRPVSLAFLAVCLTVASLFVALSMWQLNSSVKSEVTHDPAKEQVIALTQAMVPGEAMTAQQADQQVQVTGHYVPGSTRLVPGRLHEGQEGFWVVEQLQIPDSAQRWDDARGDLSIAVARGWVAHPDEVPQVPSKTVTVLGRTLPPEGPLPSTGAEPHQVGSVSPAQLTNEWNAPVYPGYVAAFAEVEAGQPLPLTDRGGVSADAPMLSSGLKELQIEQQPTDRSMHALNLFYAVEWVVFAGFALFLWWRFVRDDYLRRQNPEEYFYFEGDYFWDEQTQSFYYWDATDQRFYYFDDQPATVSHRDATERTPHHGADQ